MSRQGSLYGPEVFLVLVLISVKTGLYLVHWANVVIDLRVEIAHHDILLVGTYRLRVPGVFKVTNHGN